MNIGSLYKVKKYFWLLFPTKDTTTAAAACADINAAVTFTESAAAYADYWSKHSNCEVTYFSPDSIVVFLEEKGKYKKVLTSEGRIGWTWFTENLNYCFEEISNE